MRLVKWKSFLCIVTSSVLFMGNAAFADPVVITPLEESQAASFQSGGSGGAVSNQGPGGGTGSASSAGPSPDNGASPSYSGPSGNINGSAGSPVVPGTSDTPGTSGTPGTSSTPGTPNAPGTSGTLSTPGTGGTPGGAAGTNGGEAGTGGTQESGLADPSNIQKPVVAAEGAVLMDASTGNVLFSKSGDTKFYPASITKLMTALLVAENSSLDDKVTFSSTATTNLEAGAVSINMTAGDAMTVRQCLYALLLKSANEVGNALAEHVAGSNAKFADMMNAKAAALGCTNTHFTNPHGLNDSNHYTTPHDMAIIARAAFQNDVVKTVASTRTYILPPTIKNPSGLTVTMGHKMLNPNDARYYPGVIGGKTGYTSKAGNTLVTVAEKDGVRLVAVVMKSKSTHYTDTKAMFDYGFELAKAGALNGSGTKGPAQSAGKGWAQDGKGWYFVKENGAKAANEWIAVDGQSYWFDSDAYMAKGWRQVNGAWYFLRSNGAMAKNQWQKVDENGLWFYLGPDGAMLINTTTPDGFRVDESGACVS